MSSNSESNHAGKSAAKNAAKDDGERSAMATHWSLLLLVGVERDRAFSHFYERYRPAVATLFLRKGVSRGDLDDLVHDFFATALEHEFLAGADPARGRFRGYLRTAAERYLSSHRRSAGRQKRRPEGGLAALPDDALLAGRPELSAADAFDLAWAQALLKAAVDRTGKSLEQRGKGEHFAAFLERTYEELSWEEIATRHSTTPEAARKWVARVQDRVSRTLRTEVADTVLDAANLESELAELARIIGGKK